MSDFLDRAYADAVAAGTGGYTTVGYDPLTYSLKTTSYQFLSAAPLISSLASLSSQITSPTESAFFPSVAPTPSLAVSFETWGRNIFYLMGKCRVACPVIWCAGIEGGDTAVITAATVSFAVSLGSPLDPTETVEVSRIWADGGPNLIYDIDQVPAALIDGLSFTAYINNVLLNAVDALIVADKGADRTPGFRGQRYIVFNNLPLASVNNRFPSISVELRRVPDARLPITEVFDAVAVLAELDLSTSNIDNECDGCVVSRDITLQEFCRNSALPYNFEVIDGDTISLKHIPVGDDLVIDWEIDASECLTIEETVVSFTRANPTELPNQVEVRYSDAILNYQSGMQYARWPAPFNDAVTIGRTRVGQNAPRHRRIARGTSSAQLPFIIEAGEALSIAWDMLGRSWRQQNGFSFSLPAKYYDMRPGDVIQLTTPEQGVYLLKATNVTLKPDFTVTISATPIFDPFFTSLARPAADAGDILTRTVNRPFVHGAMPMGGIAGKRNMSAFDAVELAAGDA